jgi:hypothetical protein
VLQDLEHADCGSKVEDEINPFECPGKCVLVFDARLYDLDPPRRMVRKVLRGAGGHVVQDDYISSPCDVVIDEVRANEAGSPGDEDSH